MNIFDVFEQGVWGWGIGDFRSSCEEKKTITTTGNLSQTNSDDLEYFLQAVCVDNEGNIARPIDQVSR